MAALPERVGAWEAAAALRSEVFSCVKNATEFDGFHMVDILGVLPAGDCVSIAYPFSVCRRRMGLKPVTRYFAAACNPHAAVSADVIKQALKTDGTGRMTDQTHV